MSPVRMLVVLLLAVSAAPGHAGEAANADLDILRDTIRANKKDRKSTRLNSSHRL